jgi:hypothetical protein
MLKVLTCSKILWEVVLSILHKFMSVHQIYSTVNANEHSVLSIDHTQGQLSLGDGFRWKQFRGIDSEWFLLFHGKKWPFRGSEQNFNSLLCFLFYGREF